MSSPEEKRRKKKKTTSTKKPSPIPPETLESTPIASLPDELQLSIFARISRLYYPSLSLVSRSFRSLLASPELYKTRSFLYCTESCLYVVLRFPSDSNPRWFTLCQKPNRNLTNSIKKKKKKNSNEHVMAEISMPLSPPAQWLGLVAVGSDIYNIGSSIYKEYSSNVSILDCRSHTWREGPSMLMDRSCPAANVIDGKIYVAGGCKDSNSSNWMEVFDIKTQTWGSVLNPIVDRCESILCKSAVIKEAICVFGHKGVAYNPKEDRWEAIGELSYLDLGWVWFTYSLIDKVLFCYSNLDGIKWYNSNIGNWIMLNGLKGLPKFADYSRVKLADYGGKVAVFWDKYLPSSGYENKTIWCAVIALERRNSQEMWGKVEWLDAVLTVPKSYEFVCAISATV